MEINSSRKASSYQNSACETFPESQVQLCPTCAAHLYKINVPPSELLNGKNRYFIMVFLVRLSGTNYLPQTSQNQSRNTRTSFHSFHYLNQLTNFFQSLFAPLYSLNDGVFEEDLVEDTCPILIRIPLVIKFAYTAFDTSDLKANELAFMMALHIVF